MAENNEQTPPVDTTPANGTESSAPVETIDVEDNGDDFDFASIAGAVETEDLSQPPAVMMDPAASPPVVETPATAPAGAVPAPAPASEVSAAATPTMPQVPAEQQAAVPQAATAPTGETPQVSPSPQAVPQAPDGFTALDQAIESGRSQLIDVVAQQVYQLQAEELEAINTEPEKAIPKMLARVHVNAVQGVLRHVAQQMPAMVSGLIQAQSEYRKREDEFFTAWPQLDRTKHRDQIMKVGQVFRQLNPNATMEDFVKQVGAQVVLMNGLHVQQQNSPPPPTPQAAAFVPAGAGRSSVPPAPPDSNPWAEMVEMMNE